MSATERWRSYFKAIPDTEKILAAAIGNLGMQDLDKETARSKFCDHLQKLMLEGLRILRGAQDNVRVLFLRDTLSSELPSLSASIERELISGGAPVAVTARIIEAVSSQVAAIPAEFFSVPQKSIDQQTKKRAGVHMERAMAFLFKRAELPFEQQRPKKSDFVFPDLATWETTPELAVLVSAKHTLAERWKQLTAERHETGRNAYLATLDTLPQDKATKLIGHGFTLYVPPATMRELKPDHRIRDLDGLPLMIAKVIKSP